MSLKALALQSSHSPSCKNKRTCLGIQQTCSFGLMRFDTTLKDPEVRFQVIDIDGKKHEEYVLKEVNLSDFKMKKYLFFISYNYFATIVRQKFH